MDGAGFVAAQLIARHVHYALPAVSTLNRPVPFAVWITVSPALWVVCLASSGTYDGRLAGSGSEEYRRVLSGAVRFVALVSFLSYLARTTMAPDLVLVATPVGLLGSLVARRALRLWLARIRRGGRLRERVVLVGGEREACRFMEYLCTVPGCGMQVVGLYAGSREGWKPDLEVPVVRDREALFEMLRSGGADAVAVVDAGALGEGGLRELGWALEGLGVEIMVAPEATDVAGPRLRIRPVGGLPLVRVEEPRLSGPVRVAKEVVERVGAALVLVALSPFLALVALAIRATSPGPVLFRQARVGRQGVVFSMLKFRTMVPDAEERLVQLAEFNESDGLLFKIRRDPRVTRLGRVLRRLSVDELPQLWNVVRGQMSVVGPRPPLPSEVARYPAHVRRRLLVKPGLTGLWQVNGRADLSWEDSVRLDLHYVDNWSLLGDLLIVARTVGAVVRGSGAY